MKRKKILLLIIIIPLALIIALGAIVGYFWLGKKLPSQQPFAVIDQYLQANQELSQLAQQAALAEEQNNWQEVKAKSQAIIEVINKRQELTKQLTILTNSQQALTAISQNVKSLAIDKATINFYSKVSNCADFKLTNQRQKFYACDQETNDLAAALNKLLEAETSTNQNTNQ